MWETVVGRDERLERIKYLDGIARFYEWLTAGLVVGILTGGLLLEGLDGVAVAVLGLLLAAISGGRAYRLRRHIEDKWDEILKEDPDWIARSPLILVAMATIAAIGVIILRLILG